MTTGPPPDITKSTYAPNESRRAAALPSRFEEPFQRQQRLQRTGEKDPWTVNATLRYAPTHRGSIAASTQSSSSFQPPGLTSTERLPAAYVPLPSAPLQQWSRDPWFNRQTTFETQDNSPISPWPVSPFGAPFLKDTMSTAGEASARSAYPGWQTSWPGPLLRRTSSEEYGNYYGGENGASQMGLQAKAHAQRRPSNRDEFDGPSQLLDKPDDGGYEPKEEDLPQLPITLYAQEQDEILSKVNDRLSQCAFDFVGRYQFPIPIEPDKRPVRVPGDREWSEWVYLLKRLATKRRIPSRVLYNSQIKQLITILENSLEMRHAAKHQSRPLKDDRNILQLISSGLQVAKILKDAPAMKYLDGLYVQTERLIQSRRQPLPPTTFAGA